MMCRSDPNQVIWQILSTLTVVTSLMLPMIENYARRSSWRISMGFEEADLYVAAGMFAKCCALFYGKFFALSGFYSKWH